MDAARVAAVLVNPNPLVETLAEKKASPDSAYLVSERQPEVKVTLEGFDGDRHAGFTMPATGHTPRYPRGTVLRNTRQVSVVSAEELSEVAGALGVEAIRPEWVGANLALAGVPGLTALPPGTRLAVGEEAVFVVEGPNAPCVYPGKAIQSRLTSVSASDFPKVARGRRGVTAWVERPGRVAEGDQVRVVTPDAWFG